MLRVPLQNPDFAPFLQRARDAAPEALFAFVPSGVGSVLMRQFAERGLNTSGIRLIALGDVTDDDILNGMGEPALGVVTAHYYSAAHDSPENRKFVEGFRRLTNGARPNFMAVGGYDGMTLICKAIEAAGAAADGAQLVEAMKGMSWESPRGPVSDRPADARDDAEHLHPPRRARERRAVQRRVRHLPRGERPGEEPQPAAERRAPCSPSSSTASPTAWCCSSSPAASRSRSG